MEHETGYSGASEVNRLARVPLSHLSIEVGHLRMHDLYDVDKVRSLFRAVRPYLCAANESATAHYGQRARVSTCFLVDDYFRNDTDPAEILPNLLRIAEECGVRIDYLGREAGCWLTPARTGQGERIELAKSVSARVVEEPDEGATGRRPPTVESGWICNGRHGSEIGLVGQAMHATDYRFPVELAQAEHSIFLDVEMWRIDRTNVNGKTESHTKYSCPYLASIWQLLRLGMLRYDGEPVVDPQVPAPGVEWPRQWWELPAVMKLNPRAKPFAAYRSMSILPRSYLSIEHAVQVIVDHLQLDPAVRAQIAERAQGENVTLPEFLSDRLEHVFLARF